MGDFEELFARDYEAGMSQRRAVVRYWARVLRSIGPQTWQAIRRVGRARIARDGSETIGTAAEREGGHIRSASSPCPLSASTARVASERAKRSS